MGRKRTIDRNKVLDAAEAIVSSQGAAALTIDAVAKACGITKGGVQYCFGSKEALIDAMYMRWEAEYDAQVDALTGAAQPDPGARLKSIMLLMRQVEPDENTRAAAMLAALMQSPQLLEKNRQWYRNQLNVFDLQTREGRLQRLAFFASDALFLLRCFGFVDFAEDEWLEALADIEQFCLE